MAGQTAVYGDKARQWSATVGSVVLSIVLLDITAPQTSASTADTVRVRSNNEVILALLHEGAKRSATLLPEGRGADSTRLAILRASHGVNAVTDEAPGLFTRVRSTERFMIALIREGYNRSPGFRDLVDVLQQSNVIVFVQPASCAGGRIRSCLVSVSGSRRERHIRINVDTHTSHDWLIATVAHELQHAVEIAEHPEVIDRSGALTLYRRTAFGRCREGLSEECETTRALATERKVLEELFGRPRSVSALPAAAITPGPSPRVRSTDARMLNLLKEGTERSATFRELANAIASSDGIVYVEFGDCAFGHLNGCLLPFFASPHGARYLRILVTRDKTRRTHDQLLALVAHELRHALEVLEHPEVVDIPTMEAMFRKIGTPLSSQTGYETSAARAAGDAVLAELLAKHPTL